MEEPTNVSGRDGADEPGERSRRGCRRSLVQFAFFLIGLTILVLVATWYYTGTEHFADYVRRKIEANLEARMDREVRIGRVILRQGRISEIVLEDVRIANVPGATRPWFAVVPRVVLSGGIESFRYRQIRIGVVTIEQPQMFLEIFPDGHDSIHNFPVWKRSPPRRFEITRVEVDRLLVEGGFFEYLDHQRSLQAQAFRVDADVVPTIRKGIYVGHFRSPNSLFRYRDYEPLEATLGGRFHYEPGWMNLDEVELRGQGVQLALSGRLDPITEAVYDFRMGGQMSLATVRRVFRIERPLDGTMTFESRLTGARGDFELAGDFSIPGLTADAYELARVRGRALADDSGVRIEIASAGYRGGTLTGTYRLHEYPEPHPMSVDLRYRGISIEGLFADWEVENLGLRGAASGSLAYRWNGDELLKGRGSGTAVLQPGTTAFGRAPYPLPVSGRTEFAIERGVIRFAPSTLRTPESTIAFQGSLEIENLIGDLSFQIDSDDLSEIDRIAVNLSRAFDNPEFELLGLGGTGTIRGALRGPFGEPRVTASIRATGARFNDVLLGTADLEILYVGSADRLTFERARFELDGGTLSLEGAVTFPDTGPSPRFDLVVRADGFPVERAIEVVELDLAISGTGTGLLTVTGSPERGQANFTELRIVENGSRMTLNGLVAWLPGEGNVAFDLDLAAVSVPVRTIAEFLELGDVPVTGELTGTLHIEGPKQELEGAGAVTVRKGTIFGEPVETATADLLFTEGRLRLTHVEVRAPAGVLVGEAEIDLVTERFSYILEPTVIDLDELETFGALADLIEGRLRIGSTGAGSFQQPEIVLDAELIDGRIRGIDMPEGMAPPQIYFAVRDGQMILRASAFDAISLEGTGLVDEQGGVDGEIQLVVSDMERLLEVLAPGSEATVTGQLVASMDLGGSLRSLESLEIDGTVSTLDLQMSGHQVVAESPVHFALRDGTVSLDSISLRTHDSSFSIDGTVALTGAREIDLEIRGGVQASLLQLFAPDVTAEGLLNLRADIGGSLGEPRVTGTAEIQDGSFKFEGFPQLFDDVYATLLFRGDLIEIDALRATLGGGTIVAGGSLIHEAFSIRRVRLNLQGTDVSIRYYEGVTADGDFNLVLSGDAERLVLQGNLVIDRAVYSKDFDLTSSLLNLLLERRELVPVVAASWQDWIALRIEIAADGTLAVRNNIADLTGSSTLELTGTLANPILLGRIAIDEGGTLTFQDIDYTVVRGTVNFQNPFRNDPYFDITAESLVRRTDGDIELTVNLTGTLDRITPTITTDPPIGDLTLLSLLSGEVVPGQTRALDPTSLPAAGTSILLQTIGEALGSRILPFADSFRLDPGLIGETSGFAPIVTFEKQISNDLYVIVIYNTASAENREIVQWQVSREWVIQFTRDSEQADTYLINAIDARFRRRYPGRW